MICYACKGTNFKRQPIELVIRVGSHDVVDRSMSLPVCQSCGEYVIPADKHENAELRAALVALSDAPNTTGEMLKYARKALGFTQIEFAEQLSTTGESISRWEREERPMEPWVKLAALALIRERLMGPVQNVELKKAV
jgi:DNA-binding transcriptional regulator YiaG